MLFVVVVVFPVGICVSLIRGHGWRKCHTEGFEPVEESGNKIKKDEVRQWRGWSQLGKLESVVEEIKWEEEDGREESQKEGTGGDGAGEAEDWRKIGKEQASRRKGSWTPAPYPGLAWRSRNKGTAQESLSLAWDLHLEQRKNSKRNLSFLVLSLCFTARAHLSPSPAKPCVWRRHTDSTGLGNEPHAILGEVLQRWKIP